MHRHRLVEACAGEGANVQKATNSLAQEPLSDEHQRHGSEKESRKEAKRPKREETDAEKKQKKNPKVESSESRNVNDTEEEKKPEQSESKDSGSKEDFESETEGWKVESAATEKGMTPERKVPPPKKAKTAKQGKEAAIAESAGSKFNDKEEQGWRSGVVITPSGSTTCASPKSPFVGTGDSGFEGLVISQGSPAFESHKVE